MKPSEALDRLGLRLDDDGRGPRSRMVAAGDVTYHLHEVGDGPPLVLLHGGGPGCTAWTDFGQAAALLADRHRTFMVDLIQYGRSDKCAVDGPMWDWHAAHLTALLDALGLDRVDVACNSWGGTMALRLASLHPERVRAMVITGSMPVLHGPLGPLVDRSRRGRIARDRYYGGEGPTRGKMHELMAGLEWYDGDAIPDATVDLRYRQSLEADEIACGQDPARRGEWQDLRAHLPEVQAPTLFCWGMYDGFLSPEYPLMLANLVADGHLHVMSRASHHLQEERPEAYVAVVEAFLAEAAR